MALWMKSAEVELPEKGNWLSSALLAELADRMFLFSLVDWAPMDLRGYLGIFFF